MAALPSSAQLGSVLGSWGKTMRDAGRNTERWRRRRTPTQEPSTYRARAAERATPAPLRVDGTRSSRARPAHPEKFRVVSLLDHANRGPRRAGTVTTPSRSVRHNRARRQRRKHAQGRGLRSEEGAWGEACTKLALVPYHSLEAHRKKRCEHTIEPGPRTANA